MDNQPETTQTPQDSEYKLPSRLASYPAVASAIETAKDIYNKGKEVVPSVTAYAESSLEKGVQYLGPKVEPLLESAKPLLHKADDLSNAALDRVETHAQALKANYEATKEAFEQKVNFAKESYHNAIERTTYLSKKAQEEAFAKLQTLSLKSPEEYTVELVKYAAQVLDQGVSVVNQTVSKGVETGTTLIKEAPKEIKEKIQSTTSDALAAIHTAVEVISKQIPAEVSTKFEHLKEYAAKGEEARVELFSSVAQNSSKLLSEIGTTISGYVSKGEAIPQQILASSYERLQKVLDSLLTIIEPKKNENGDAPKQ